MESLEKHFPSARSEWKENDPISFIDPASGLTMQGTVIHSIAPIEQVGRVHPLLYVVDCGDGFPHVITSGDITA